MYLGTSLIYNVFQINSTRNWSKMDSILPQKSTILEKKIQDLEKIIRMDVTKKR